MKIIRALSIMSTLTAAFVGLTASAFPGGFGPECYEGRVFYSQSRLERTYLDSWQAVLDPALGKINFYELQRQGNLIQLEAYKYDQAVELDLDHGTISFSGELVSKTYPIANMGYRCLYNPWLINSVTYNERGRFEVVDMEASGGLSWVEKGLIGDVIDRYREIERFPNAIILQSKSRPDLQVTMHLDSKTIAYTTKPWDDDITRFTTADKDLDYQLWKISAIRHSGGGRFEPTVDSEGTITWIERDPHGAVIFKFERFYRGGSQLELVDEDRNLSLTIDLKQKNIDMSLYESGESFWLYHVTGVDLNQQ
ncbi:hypothetical protein [Pseudobacteriovorax antillogorgiicola]|uniref:Uncharacterized protein n=1 Tax=Pseudobacteriovorax antillogorgiicola TaxID=1513793 RepID=A0A1Y6BWS0_9BACT|nr:hypothetical protein [Pseudobacteriovorax antillogorgiicola]TCS52385.1 hypothetical protein EDD56_109130 [Pseudobacteriovorax antillogorgiicola]SMF29199.1 hypothetical protein SAMN06296036_10983 [Pseudobacteriovorax antillogorgiicola]